MYNQLKIIENASILIAEKKYSEAKDVLLEFIKNVKNVKIDIKLYYSLYLAFDGLKEIQNAKKYLEKCLKINEKNHIVLNNLGNIFFREGNTLKAEKFYLKSFETKNDYLISIINLAILYQNIGKFDDSKKFYIKAINLSPKQISIYYNLSRVDKDFIDEKKISYLLDLMKSKKNELLEMSYGFFLLAEYERKKKNFSKEIEYLKNAHHYLFDSKKKINTQVLSYWKNIIPAKYNKFIFVNEYKKNELSDLKPIFIVGLPRSGSTVTEALLSSGEKKIISLGESSIFNGIISKGFSLDQDNFLDVNFITNKILNILNDKNFNIKNSIFIDKSLENFFYIDVILKVFPQAKFINTFRNTEDNVFAIYKQSFSKIPWTHSFKDVLEYIDNYLKVIDYFFKKHPDKILSIQLEDLTTNSEKTSKKLYSFCNLKWSDDVLNFYNRQDLLISSASNIQIREKIKKYDQEKYKPYKDLLKRFSNKYDWLNKK
jgi:tetratricopeptide (TPR) repeat protein